MLRVSEREGVCVSWGSVSSHVGGRSRADIGGRIRVRAAGLGQHDKDGRIEKAMQKSHLAHAGRKR